MSRGPTRGIVREREDFTQLLNEIKKHNETESFQEANKPYAAENVSSQPSLFRQRLLSDTDVRYFSSKNGKTAHDKTCPLAREIPDDNLVWTRDYPYNLRQCPECCVKAYTRLGARDFSRFNEYKRLFEAMGFEPQDLKLMYVEENMETSIMGADTLRVRCRNDTWMIRRMSGSSKVELLHNNYIGYPNGTRKFTGGYHRQAIFSRPVFAVKRIASYRYSYEAHTEAELRKKIRYVYELGGDTFHDETCPVAKDIPASNRRVTENCPSHLKPCPICNTKVCVRLGARDFEKFSEYEEFFTASHIPQRTVRRMYMYDNMETEIVSPTLLKVWHGDDVWGLEVLSDFRGIRLWHGNFKARPDGTRTPAKGFHKQGDFQRTYKAVAAIAEYTYQPERQRKGFSVWLRRLLRKASAANRNI